MIPQRHRENGIWGLQSNRWSDSERYGQCGIRPYQGNRRYREEWTLERTKDQRDALVERGRERIRSNSAVGSFGDLIARES